MATPDYSLPARGRTPELTLAKKLPKAVDIVLVGIFAGVDNEIELPCSPLFDSATLRETYNALAAVGAKTTLGAITRIPAPADLSAKVIVAVGLGSPAELDDDTLRRAAGCAARALADDSCAVTALNSLGLAPVVEGLILGGYSYRGIRSADKVGSADAPTDPVAITLLSDSKADKAEFVSAQVIAESVAFARDLVNTPSSHLYPESYAAVLTTEASTHGVDVEVLDDTALAKQGYGGILAVGGGSARLPRLVRLHWTGGKRKAVKVGLVGKGITFDTGGISLKPAAKMENMISDMGGSAAMAAVVIAAARLGLPINVTATLPLAENMPSGTATRPGDVITHYGGITSEVLNTDAEGRLVLADALARASEDKPDYLVDAATLTGAQMVALGAYTTGVMGTDELRDHLAALGREVGENAWAMPLLSEHAEELTSPVADIRNHANSRNGGMLFAASYLQKFVGEDIEWAHLDIAGPSFNEGKVDGYTVKRATGVPVRTLIAWLRELAEK